MRFCGNVYYFDTIETKPGKFEEKLTPREYKGDVLRNTKRNQDSSNINTNIVVNNSISIVADPYARDHFFKIKCVEWQGALWRVSSVDASNPPRLVLELGGLYDEELE